MIIVMKGSTPKEQVHDVIRTIEELGYQPHVIWGRSARSSAPWATSAARLGSTRWR